MLHRFLIKVHALRASAPISLRSSSPSSDTLGTPKYTKCMSAENRIGIATAKKAAPRDGLFKLSGKAA
tara:strand:- start:503 stop:706 length:204 start_codon:yes stop_codon:yes gene_type:complete